MTDLFHRLTINHPHGDIPGARVDVGWRAWASRAPQARAGRWQRWLFWRALWRFFGQPRYLVQVDDRYLMATSVSISNDDDGRIRVTLMQRTGIIGHYLRFALWRRSNPLHLQFAGNAVRISQAQPSLTIPAALKHCPEALLDSEYALSLPLIITRYSGDKALA